LVVSRPQFPSPKQREEMMLQRKQQALAKEKAEREKEQETDRVATQDVSKKS
jgi:hypothetical protein